jgi:hypothetical protein
MNRPARIPKFGALPGGVAVVAPRPLAAIAATRSGGVPQARIRQVFGDLMAPLQALHDERRVHGSISTETIGLDEWGRAMLLVPALFLARSAGDVALREGRASGFNAFEQYTDDPAWAVGPWTDVYALSAVACSLVSGETPQSAIDRCVRDDYVPLADRGQEGYDAAFLAAIDSGLRLFPAERPATLKAFADAVGAPFGLPDSPPIPEEKSSPPLIARLPQPLPSAAAPAEAPSVRAKPSPSRRPLAVGLLLLIVAAAATFFWMRVSSRSDDVHAQLPVKPAPGGVLATRESFRPVWPAAPARAQSAVPGTVGGNGVFGADGVNVGAADYAPASASASGGAVFGAAGANGPIRVMTPMGAAGPIGTMAMPAPTAAVAAANGNISSIAEGAAESGRIAAIGAAAAQGLPLAAPGAAPQPDAPGASVAAPVAVAPAVTAPITVALRLSPWGEVFVNGASQGVSPPLRSIRLAPGRYHISVRNPGAAPFDTTLTVRSGQKASISHSFD